MHDLKVKDSPDAWSRQRLRGRKCTLWCVSRLKAYKKPYKIGAGVGWTVGCLHLSIVSPSCAPKSLFHLWPGPIYGEQSLHSMTFVQVIRDKNSLQSRGFAFVSYSQPHFAAAALQQMNGCLLYGNFRGRALKVGPSNRII